VRFVKHDAVRLIAIKVATEISAMRCIFQRNSQESVDFPGPVIVRLRLDDGPLQVGTCLDRVCVYLLHEESRTSPRRRCAATSAARSLTTMARTLNRDSPSSAAIAAAVIPKESTRLELDSRKSRGWTGGRWKKHVETRNNP
jgi:hypothetical protein